MTLGQVAPRRDGKSARQEMEWRVATLRGQAESELEQQREHVAAAFAFGERAAGLEKLAQSYAEALDILPE
jgi:hypothetical protein